MTALAQPGRLFLWRGVVDMRKSFDGLSGIVREGLAKNPLTGDWFIFLNRRRCLVKVLYWDRDGYALWSKRLERGRFTVPSGETPEIGRAELALLLEGVQAKVVRRSPRWHSC